MTFPPDVLPIASISAMRPVFMIVMGAFLLLTSWRMTRVAGALLLAIGYSVVMPLYQAGVLIPLSQIGVSSAEAASALGWHVVKTVSMNGGWLVFGFGLALHAGIFETEKSSAPVEAPSSSPVHGTTA
jgi:hypothetical protein